jgi:hypothetical protein
MNQHNTRTCPVYGEDISQTHRNRKFCSTKCSDKERYKRCGQRVSSEQRKVYYKERLKKNGYADNLRQQGRERYYTVQNFLRSYKTEKGCADCGYNSHHAALEFDHVLSGKELNVCTAKSIEQAKKEIEKCEVVCSNCHKIRTYNRLQKNPCKPDIFEKTYERAETFDEIRDNFFNK